MAVMTQNFSIREYAARKRADVGFNNCWPFRSGGEDAPTLPPISVRKFRWWEDEVSAWRSEALREEEGCPYKTYSAPESEVIADDKIVDGKAPSPSLTPLDDEDAEAAPGSPSRVEGRRPSKGKLRTPKKRSIVELFAAAPQVEVAVSEDEADDGGGWCREEEDKGGDVEGGHGVAEHESEIELSTKTKKNQMKQSKMKRKRRKKKKGFREAQKVELRDWVKEKICPKVSSVYSSMLRHTFCSKRIKSAKSPVGSQRKLNSTKPILVKHRDMQTSKLMSRKRVARKKIPIHRVYKNQEKHTRRSSKIISSRAVKVAKLHCKSKKHVTFSTKDDILEHGDGKTCSNMNHPRPKSVCEIFSGALVASSVMNRSCILPDVPDAIDRPQMVSSSENGILGGIINRIEASSSERIGLSDSHVIANRPTIVNSSISSSSGTEKASFAVMFDLNHAVENTCDLDDLSPAASTFSPNIIYSDDHTRRGTTYKKDSNSTALIHQEASLPTASDANLMPIPHDKFVNVSDAKSLPTVMNNSGSYSSTSRIIASNMINERHYQPHIHAMMNNCHPIEENQSACVCPSMGLLGSTCYSMGSESFGESGLTQELSSLCKSKCCEDFIGLPLNSQGELIHLNAGAKFSEMCKRQNTELRSSYGLSANKHAESSHLETKKKKVVGPASYLKDQYYSTRERVRNWLNFTEFTGPQALEVQNNVPTKDKEGSLHSNSNSTNLSLHESRCGNTKPEGRCIFDRQRPHVQSVMRLMGTNVIVGGINKDCHSFEDRAWSNNQNFDEKAQFAIIPERNISEQWMPTEWRADVNQLLSDSTSNFCHRDGLEPKVDTMQISQPHWLPRTLSSATVNPNFKLNMDRPTLPPQTMLIKPNQFLGNPISGKGSMGYHYPAAVSSHQNVYHNMLMGSTPYRPEHRVPCGTLSTTRPQLHYDDQLNRSHPPLMKHPANLPQWLLHTNQQKQNQRSGTHYCDPTAINPACSVSGTNLNSHLSASQVPKVPLTSPHCPCHRACSSSFIPHIPTTRKNERDGLFSKLGTFQGPFDSLKLRKRHADVDGPMNPPAKRSCLTNQVLNQMKKCTTLDKAIPLDLQKTEKEKTECRIPTGSSSSRFDKELGSGPTKLIAGLKHILLPCQRIEDDKCRPIHTTRPFSSDAAAGKFFGPQVKIANIYKF